MAGEQHENCVIMATESSKQGLFLQPVLRDFPKKVALRSQKCGWRPKDIWCSAQGLLALQA
jgi:RNA:NAD 2'-phosphotransferase (TPT1/KptA family)